MIRAGFIIGLLLFAGQDDRDEYDKKLEKIKEGDAKGHYALADWCRKKKLWDLALEQYEAVLELDPKHRKARKALGYRKKGKEWQRDGKVAKLWTYRSAVMKGLTFPPSDEIAKWRKSGSDYARVIDVMLDIDVWVDALRAIDERTGLFDGNLKITMSFKSLNGALATGGGTGNGNGTIEVDMERMAKQVRDLDAMKKLRVIVPPSPIPLVFKHELVHCYQGVVGTGWMLEGVPSFVAEDLHFLAFYQNDKQKTGDIEDKIPGQYDYGRGWAFCEYVKAKYGQEKLNTFFDLFYKKRKPVTEAIEEATGDKWEKIRASEKSWSASWIRKFKGRK